MVETAKRINCPACGAKITRQELSLCSYCGSPLGLIGEQAKAKDDATSQRLAKMRQHPEFEAAMARTPAEESPVRGLVVGALLESAGLALVVYALSGELFGAGGGGIRFFPLGVGAVVVLAGTARIVQAARSRTKAASLPLLKRPAIVKDRRSITESKGGKARTTYYFLLAFEDGAEAEFAFPGRGTSHELLVPGYTGVACTRGATIVDFSRIRV